jgi:cytochrome c-type biogenesis protein CcmH/NrfG
MADAGEASQLLRRGQAHQFADPPDYAAAEKAYREAIQASPGWGESSHWLGSALEQQGRLQDAADAFARASRLLPGDPRPIIAHGHVRRLSGQYQEAIDLLEAAIALKPHCAEADARLMLADAFMCGGKHEQAVAEWRIVAQMNPSYPSHEKPMEEAKRRLASHGLGR